MTILEIIVFLIALFIVLIFAKRFLYIVLDKIISDSDKNKRK